MLFVFLSPLFFNSRNVGRLRATENWHSVPRVGDSGKRAAKKGSRKSRANGGREKEKARRSKERTARAIAMGWVESIVNADTSCPSRLTRGKGNSPGRLRRFPRRLACPCGDVFVGWERRRLPRGLRGHERDSLSRSFFIYFLYLCPFGGGSLTFSRISIQIERERQRVFTYECTLHKHRADFVVRERCEKCRPVNDGCRSVILDDAAGEYFQITRHFRLSVARLYSVCASTFCNAYTHTYATHAQTLQIRTDA